MTRGSGRPPGQRQLRVGEELRHALAEIFAHGGLRDPALRDASVTVTEVRVSPDLRNATAFVTPLGGGDAVALLAALARAAPYVRGQIGRMVRLKYTPAIAFELDTSFERASHIDALLRQPAVAADLDKEGDADNGGA